MGIVAPARDGAIERGLAALGYELAWLPFRTPADFVDRVVAFGPAVVLNLGVGRLADDAARALGLAAARALRCSDHARVELELDRDGAPRVRAVATDLPALADRWGAGPAELADRLIRLVAATPPERRAYERV